MKPLFKCHYCGRPTKMASTFERVEEDKIDPAHVRPSICYPCVEREQEEVTLATQFVPAEILIHAV